ncbi:MAG: UDP-N-acetylmuramate dehydrogenase [Promethearchaeota archaeon]
MKQEEPMKDYTSFKIGGIADLIAYPVDLEDLITLLIEVQKERFKYFILGNGTNVLVRDGGYRGVVICQKNMNKIKIIEESRALCGSSSVLSIEAGADLSKIINFASFHNLTGIEFAAGIPGTLGGAICMNAGTPAKTISEIVKSITLLTPFGESLYHRNDEMEFNYRTANIPKDHIIYEAKIILRKGDKMKIESEIKNLIKHLKGRQPWDLPNAGSIFKNPPNNSAGKLIESVGLKGTKIGGAQISQKHANFIVNTGGARADDVIELMELVKEKVLKTYNIKLEPEITIIGEE